MNRSRLYSACLLFFFPLLLTAQNELTDALFLKKHSEYDPAAQTITIKYKTKLQRDSVYSVIAKYFPAFTDSSDFDDFRTAVAANPFYKGKVKLAGVEQEALGKAALNKSINSSLAGIGGINVTNFADGLARFMVERFKEELSTSFFERFKEDLNAPEYKDLQLLFPQTQKILNTIDKNIYQYTIYINSLREAFKNDLSNLYAGMENVMDQKVYRDYFSSRPELKTILDVSGYLINAYAKGTHPGKVLADFDTTLLRSVNTTMQTNTRAAVATLQLFSESLRSSSGDRYWHSSSELPTVQDPVLKRLYFGLLYQNKSLPAIRFTAESSHSSITLKSVFDSIAHTADSLNVYLLFIQNFTNEAGEVSDYVQELKEKNKKDIDYNDYYKLFNSAIDLFEYTSQAIDLPYAGQAIPAHIRNGIRMQSVRWLFVARASADLYVDVRTQNYSSAIINAVTIIDTVLNTGVAQRLLELKKAADGYAEKLAAGRSKKELKALNGQVDEYTARGESVSLRTLQDNPATKGFNDSILRKAVDLIATRENMDQLHARGKVREALLKYGSFMAAIANAQNSDDVKAAIESTVLPAGSYSVKRETNFNISVNGFVGPYAGTEYLPALKQKAWAGTVGFTAPVGIAFSWGNYGSGLRKDPPVVKLNSRQKPRGGQSVSIFVSLIDVGALASYRLGNDSSKVSSEIQLKNIVAPGAYFYWGLPKCPISLGIGAQVGPQLRQVTATQADIDRNFYLRVGMSLVVDIPFYNIYSRN